MKWARWYRGAVSNPKFKMVARRASKPSDCGDGDRVLGAVSLTDVIAVWAVMFEDATKKEHWGTVTKSAEYIAVMLDWGADEVQSVLDELVNVGSVQRTDAGLKILNWNEYQYTSDHDPTNKDRQRRYYEKHKRAPNALETEPNAKQTRTDTDTDTDKKEKITRSRASYPEDFENFWKGYPSKSGKHEALAEWKKLSAEDRKRAADSVPGFKEWIGKQSKDYTVLWACRYLKRRRFEDYPSQSATILPTGTTFHALEGSPEMAAWDQHWKLTRGVLAPRSRRLDGAIFSTRWPPGHPGNETPAEPLEAIGGRPVGTAGYA